jgi:hypothetical protein
MENKLKKEILLIVQLAEDAYVNALRPENRDELGYPYVAGYAESALRNIRDLVKEAK